MAAGPVGWLPNAGTSLTAVAAPIARGSGDSPPHDASMP
jgi:hypothetical protein